MLSLICSAELKVEEIRKIADPMERYLKLFYLCLTELKSLDKDVGIEIVYMDTKIEESLNPGLTSDPIIKI